MPNINEIRQSNFLKRADVGQGTLVTITGCAQYNVAKEGAPEELKYCLEFKEFEKPMVLNSTNAQLCAQALGSDETDGWMGKQIVLFDDPSVSFGGKLVGGIRVRASRRPQLMAPAKAQPKSASKAVLNPQPTPEPEPDPSDLAGEDASVPF